MKILHLIFQRAYQLWVFLVFTIFMILYLPGILIPFLFGNRASAVGYLFLKLWSWTFSILNFIRYDVHGREKIDRNKAYIYICNHTSYLDIPGISITIPTQFRPLAKKELKKIPIFGWIAQSACVIVDRSSNESRRKSMEHLKTILREGIPILIFPEGTQNRSTEVLQPFYDGAFRIAIETKCPILPMVTLNAGNLMPPSTIRLKPGTIKVIIGDEIETSSLDMKDATLLKEKTREAMLKLIQDNR